MKGFVLALALLLGPAAPRLPARQGTETARADAFVSTDRVAPGGTFRVAVRLTIEPGWHVQSNKPLDPAYIATVLSIGDEPGIALGDAVYQRGVVKDFPGLGGKLSVYEGTVLFGATLAVDSSAAPGRRTIKGKVRVQACNDTQCLIPEDLEVGFPIEVGPGPATPKNTDLFASIDFSKGEEGAKLAAASGGAKKGVLATLLSIFLLGLALNLTPCVYPVVAVTIGFFGRQAQSGSGNRLVLSVAYALGIALTFTALGVAASLTGGAFGGWLQNRWVLLGLAALIVAFSLSCFGLFEIQAPTWLLSKAGGGKTGAVGALLMGLTMGITAAPCVGPLILTLIIAVAKEGSVSKGLLWFGTLSAGLSLPYVALGFFSGSTKGLPKYGDWTKWFERLLGFVLLGVAIWFANPLFPSEWLLPLFALLALVAGAWLGIFERTGRGANALWFIRGALFVASIVGALAIYGRSRAEGIEWRPYEARLLAAAAEGKRPVLIDVTAKWCAPCRLMEEGAFKDRRVIERSRAFERLRIDRTGEPDENVKDAIERFGADVRGKKRLDPPQIIFLDAEGREITDHRANEAIGAGELLRRLELALRGAP